MWPYVVQLSAAEQEVLYRAVYIASNSYNFAQQYAPRSERDPRGTTYLLAAGALQQGHRYVLQVLWDLRPDTPGVANPLRLFFNRKETKVLRRVCSKLNIALRNQ
jgi:hypothetical protein